MLSQETKPVLMKLPTAKTVSATASAPQAAAAQEVEDTIVKILHEAAAE